MYGVLFDLSAHHVTSVLSRSWVALWSLSVSISPESVHYVYTTIVFIIWSPCYAVIFVLFLVISGRRVCVKLFSQRCRIMWWSPSRQYRWLAEDTRRSGCHRLRASVSDSAEIYIQTNFPVVFHEMFRKAREVRIIYSYFVLNEAEMISFSAVMLEDAWSLNFFSWKKETMWKRLITATIDWGAWKKERENKNVKKKEEEEKKKQKQANVEF